MRHIASEILYIAEYDDIDKKIDCTRKFIEIFMDNCTQFKVLLLWTQSVVTNDIVTSLTQWVVNLKNYQRQDHLCNSKFLADTKIIQSVLKSKIN